MVDQLKVSPLNQAHVELGAHLIDFAGWRLPGWYSSIVTEHLAVRNDCGLFDVSHLGRFKITGPDAFSFLQHVVTIDVNAVPAGRTHYTLMCQTDGGIIDDPVLFHPENSNYLLTVNAIVKDTDLRWLTDTSAGYQVITEDRSAETAMFALQGPRSALILEELAFPSPKELNPYDCTRAKVAGKDVILSRTGYTGEDGFELIVPAEDSLHVWKTILDKGVTPCGLGARDTLRLEAGYVLYGNDIDTTTNPFEAGLGWLVHWQKGNFIGRETLTTINQMGAPRKLIGFIMLNREVPRKGYPFSDSGLEVGTVTSGSYSPVLKVGIGLGYIKRELASVGREVHVLIRDHPAPARIAKKPFYKRPGA